MMFAFSGRRFLRVLRERREIETQRPLRLSVASVLSFLGSTEDTEN